MASPFHRNYFLYFLKTSHCPFHHHSRTSRAQNIPLVRLPLIISNLINISGIIHHLPQLLLSVFKKQIKSVLHLLKLHLHLVHIFFQHGKLVRSFFCRLRHNIQPIQLFHYFMT